MPKVHNIGKDKFIQLIDFPVEWGWKVAVKGWTQEIEFPFRTANPLIVRLPNHKAIAFGTWTGQAEDEESALNNAMQGRVLTDEDFDKEKGWTPAAVPNSEEDSWLVY